MLEVALVYGFTMIAHLGRLQWARKHLLIASRKVACCERKQSWWDGLGRNE
jgi:hypothetical protein